MIEALIVIGGIIGIAAVGLSASGRMTKWWSSALYALMTASLAVLMVTGFYALDADSDIAALWYVRLSFAAVIVALTCLYFLAQELESSSTANKTGRIVQWGIFWIAGFLGVLASTPFMIVSVHIAPSGVWLVNATWGAVLFAIYTMSLMVLLVYQVIKQVQISYRRRYGTLDFRFMVVRTVSYILTLMVAVLVFYGIAYLLKAVLIHNEGSSLVSVIPGSVAVIVALVTALSFQPIRHLFNTYIDKLFYKDNYSITDFTTRISQTLNSTNDLRILLERVGAVIAGTVKASQAFFFVHLPEDRYMTAGTAGHSKVTPAEFDDTDKPSPQRRRPILIAQFDSSHPLHRMMVSHRLGLIFPLYKGDTLIGYLCLGRSKGPGYTSRDIRSLKAVADEIAIAIQNALSVEEVKRLNDTLEQRVNSATKELRASNAQLQRLDMAKDEFISMASHQLRTPLTSIKGYISMMLEGDVGKVTDEQKHVLKEAFVSSERMVRLIGDFLNVSRLQTGKFVIEKHPIDLARLVEREVDGLAQHASARGIQFVYKKPKDLPLLELDENKIQQVVMNFADNAIFYSKEKSKVVVTLEQVGQSVEFKVVDSGIGVPKAEQDQLFHKFFRATNARKARPDGTGVGLFLARKVITDHDGEIIFESEEGKGSTFGFRLPLP